MMNRTSKIVLSTSAMFLALFVGRPETAQGASATPSTITVSANVVKACTISDAVLAFGQYDPLNANDNLATGTISFTCTNGVTATIDLAAGGHAASGARGMANGTNILPYQIYTTNSRTTVWGTALTGGASVTAAGTGQAASVTMYGTIPHGTITAIDGSYGDTLQATLNF